VKAELPVGEKEEETPKKSRSKKKPPPKEEVDENSTDEEGENYKLLKVRDEKGDATLEPPRRKEIGGIVHYVDEESIEMYHGHKVSKLVQTLYCLATVCSFFLIFSVFSSLYFFHFFIHRCSFSKTFFLNRLSVTTLSPTHPRKNS
jgi:hypothetical protein